VLGHIYRKHVAGAEKSPPPRCMQDAVGLTFIQGVRSHSRTPWARGNIIVPRRRGSSICWGVTSDATPPARTNRPPTPQDDERAGPQSELCDVCGSDRLIWRSCKLICTNCRSMLKSCADLW